MAEINKEEKATFLLVTDLHCRVDHVKRIKDFLRDENILSRIDAVLCAGDIADLQDSDLGDCGAVAASEGDASDVVGNLEAICARVVYIPGNHDSPALFRTVPGCTGTGVDAAQGPDDDHGSEGNNNNSGSGNSNSVLASAPHITPLSFNTHGRSVRVAEGVSIVGLGGSVPSFQAGQRLWPGYPFTSDEEFAPVVERTLSRGKESELSRVLGGGDQVILMTHVAPEGTSTSLEYRPVSEGGSIETGSASLRAALEEPETQRDAADGKILALIHGHSHGAYGQGRVGNVCVINPGPAVHAQFGILTLRRCAAGVPWRVAAYEFHSLPRE